MNDNRVMPEQIDAIMNAAEVTVEDRFGCMTVVHAKLSCGFIITETSACIDSANYDRKIGEEICMERVRNKVWELEGYHKMRRNADVE
ncbi:MULTISPECIES: Gp49 family protein [Gordonibacter]|uniref:Gp49 family protein n=1 Tax=Gordonibacter faecis TaxID=3047475 RepID=A0ABT7DSV6_9ACTN|nr:MULTISPECIES: Gp49 family protein [unclassified Gordonibacter]MDJ1651616.1 Gp49 family protein [Gordonibacter sp. KGMB12511]HIW77038.1 hypothetical protein [Candidatus Gordonibacter avicola]